MRASSEYKDLAIKSLEGNWLTAAVATFIYALCAGGISGVLSLLNPPATPTFDPATATFADIFLSSMSSSVSAYDIIRVLLLPVSYGYALIILKMTRGNGIALGDLFSGFKQYARVFLTVLLKYVYTILWSMLLIVPGIIKAYSYSMTEFVMIDNPNLSYDAAIRESMRLMRGRKFDLFFLDLTFIGWGILCLLTLGIGFLFLNPYMHSAHAHFYQDILAEEGSAKGDYVVA